MTVSERFNTFLENIRLTAQQRDDGAGKHRGVRNCLNRHYYNSSSDSAHSFLVGSWGKSTEIRPPRDIDIFFELPPPVFERYQSRPGNKQSQLLQEVKGVLQATYPNTKMRADGQVVVVPFASFAVELVPAFCLTSGQYWICDTNGGGQYKIADPTAEADAVKTSNDATAGNTRDLIRMMKCWQANCSVPLKSFYIELLAVSFLATWDYRGKSATYYDWMIRDFLSFLMGKKLWGFVVVPGTNEYIYLGNDWVSRAEAAHARAVKACAHEDKNEPYSAGIEWQKIFGTEIPAG